LNRILTNAIGIMTIRDLGIIDLVVEIDAVQADDDWTVCGTVDQYDRLALPCQTTPAQTVVAAGIAIGRIGLRVYAS
jgi:hypothetical protein